jgi:hypothetical protein
VAAAFGFTTRAYAATVTAASCSQSAITAALATAANGDTVLVPAGTCEWTSQLVVTNKAVTIQGAGIGKTIIVDSVALTSSAVASRLVTLEPGPNQAVRFSGFEFRQGARTQSFGERIAMVGSYSDARTVRVDNSKFDHLAGEAIIAFNVRGVIDHNVYIGTPTNRFLNVWSPNYNGGVYGDGNWAAPAGWGSADFTFIEDNVMSYDGTSNYAFIDAFAGARFVFRNNTVTCGWVEAHGTESTGRFRGTRAVEVYNNTFVSGVCSGDYVTNLRSGSMLVWGNRITGYLPHPRFELANYRNGQGFAPWGMADGSNALDRNVAGVLNEALDQPGKGAGGLLTGDTPVYPWPAGSNNQADEPCYEWDNLANGADMGFEPGASTIRVNEHFFVNTPAPGYTPYAYPHPLVSGAPAPPLSPSAPTNLRISP